MSQFSGFIPIRFRLVGKLLLGLGILGLILIGLSTITGWFSLPSYSILFCLIVIAVSVYVLLVSREEKNR
jgi:hypothetical protein